MVLKAFWGSLGLLLGALGALLGVSWELLRASGSTKEGLQIRLGTLLGLVCSLLAAEDGFGSVLGLSLARFGCSRGPFKGCFGIRQTDFDHQNCPSELRYLIFLAVVVVLLLLLLVLVLVLVLLLVLVVVVVAAVVVVVVLVSLLPCNFSSIRLGGMRRAIE